MSGPAPSPPAWPLRLRLSRAKGYRLQDQSPDGRPVRIVARPTKFGNPFTIASWRAAGYVGSDEVARAACAEAFREWLANGDDGRHRAVEPMQRRWILEELDALAGLHLACWCPLPEPGQPDHCHAAVLIALANRETHDED